MLGIARHRQGGSQSCVKAEHDVDILKRELEVVKQDDAEQRASGTTGATLPERRALKICQLSRLEVGSPGHTH